MKNILFPFIIFLGVTACKKPPSSVNFSGNQGADGGKNTLVTDKYVGLTCNTSNPYGLRLWRRLSNTEYSNTVKAVFNVDASAYDTLPTDVTKTGIYDTVMESSNFVNSIRMPAYNAASKKIAEKAVGTSLPCFAEGVSCITKTLPALGELAWRRPLSADEITKLTGIFTATAGEIGNNEAAKLVLRALLMGESFLYRSEMGGASAGSDGTYTLTDWEMASALSYTILKMPPDQTLRGLAASKKLSSKDEIAKQVTRLFADAQAKTAWKDFASMWLETKHILDQEVKSTKITDAVKKDASKEAGELFSDIFTKTSGSNLEALYGADSLPSSGSTNAIYNGTSANGRIVFKEAERRGVLGLASYLIPTASLEYTSPVKRGAFIIERMICTGFAPVGKFELPPREAGETNRQRYEKIGKSKACGSCHGPMNQFGFAMENFDQLGAFRTEADGAQIQTESKVSIDGKDIVVNSASELSAAIAQSSQGKECFSRHIFRFALGRQEYSPMPIIGASSGSMVTVTKQTDADSCQIKSMTDSMERADGDLKAPIIELLTSESFRKRINRQTQD